MNKINVIGRGNVTTNVDGNSHKPDLGKPSSECAKEEPIACKEHTHHDDPWWKPTPRHWTFLTKGTAFSMLLGASIIRIFTDLEFPMSDIIEPALWIASLGVPIDVSIVIGNLGALLKKSST
jgi:hypothetical protein